ncbi:glycine betaine/L-proline ABC transporter permease ProW [Kiloniella sp.]|uniref:glycine betaine/L-proline ABC transporter permease ProW n=1 Tax=Kiloniella sp. TaxID=1938587 RepID=UPI003B01D1BB
MEFDLLNPFTETLIPLGSWVESGLDWLVSNFRPFFKSVREPIDFVLNGVEAGLLSLHPYVAIAITFFLGWQLKDIRMGFWAALALGFIGAIGAYQETMLTLSLVLTSLFFCVLIGIPTGILVAKRPKADRLVRPILDTMQTTPAFVYLVPIVMLFGIGNVPGVIVTIIFALPPLVRLTTLGIRQVPADVIEASHAFGASEMQMLFKVELPLAKRTIMAGVNQTLMLSLSMVVIGSMISVAGLGRMVLRGIGRLDMGLATIGGISIVLLAIILDRYTQALAEKKEDTVTEESFKTRGPVGFVRRMIGST